MDSRYRSNWWLCAALALAAALLAPACGGKTYVRGSEVEDLDDPAMSTGLDRRDLEKLLSENLQAMMSSTTAREWDATKRLPKVAVYPLANETTEHVDSQLQALLSDIETYLLGTGLVKVISVERQGQMIGEVNKQHSGHFDPNQIVERSRQLGAEYYVTGKVFSADERTDEGRRVQYFMFMQLIEVATSAVAWQHKTQLTKGLIDAD